MGPRSRSTAEIDTSTPDLRRGTVVVVSQRLSGWGVDSRGAYAQVAIDARSPDRIEGAADANRPFIVIGAFTDGDLIDIVGLIRSGPAPASAAPVPPPAPSAATQGPESLPASGTVVPVRTEPAPPWWNPRMVIRSIERRDDADTAAVRGENWVVTLKRDGDRWAATSASVFVN